jgi:hypothetical protein
VDRDGNLSGEECGFFLGRNANIPPDERDRARHDFMSENPVLASLDTDGDGEISATEIANSAASLKRLDHNGDGILTADELIPHARRSQ